MGLKGGDGALYYWMEEGMETRFVCSWRDVAGLQIGWVERTGGLLDGCGVP